MCFLEAVAYISWEISKWAYPISWWSWKNSMSYKCHADSVEGAVSPCAEAKDFTGKQDMEEAAWVAAFGKAPS